MAIPELCIGSIVIRLNALSTSTNDHLILITLARTIRRSLNIRPGQFIQFYVSFGVVFRKLLHVNVSIGLVFR